MWHFLTKNPDVHLSRELKQDELAESKRWAEQAAGTQRNFFRWLAETRDRAEPGKVRGSEVGGRAVMGWECLACAMRMCAPHMPARPGRRWPNRTALTPAHTSCPPPLLQDTRIFR